MESFESILKQLQRYIETIALSTGQYEYFDDLCQVGAVGAWNAYQRFDESNGTPFIGFAHFYIKKEIYGFLDKHARTIRIPENALRDKEFSSSTKTVSIEDLRRTTNNDLYSRLEDILSSVEDITPPEYESLYKAIKTLSDKEQMLIQHYYGFEPYVKMNTIELGEMLQVTKQAISLRINKIQLKIKSFIQNGPSTKKKRKSVIQRNK